MINKFFVLCAPFVFFFSSYAYGYDFNLLPLAQGGNADMADFNFSETLKNPSKYIGKTIVLPINFCFDSASLMGGTDGIENKNYKGELCATSGGSEVGIVADLEGRDLLKSHKVKEVEGKIVGISEQYKLIIEPKNYLQ